MTEEVKIELDLEEFARAMRMIAEGSRNLEGAWTQESRRSWAKDFDEAAAKIAEALAADSDEIERLFGFDR